MEYSMSVPLIRLILVNDRGYACWSDDYPLIHGKIDTTALISLLMLALPTHTPINTDEVNEAIDLIQKKVRGMFPPFVPPKRKDGGAAVFGEVPLPFEYKVYIYESYQSDCRDIDEYTHPSGRRRFDPIKYLAFLGIL